VPAQSAALPADPVVWHAPPNGQELKGLLQLRWLNGFQERLADDLINAISSQSLADLDGQLGMRLAAL